jgi:hypothetical protein
LFKRKVLGSLENEVLYGIVLVVAGFDRGHFVEVKLQESFFVWLERDVEFG